MATQLERERIIGGVIPEADLKQREAELRARSEQVLQVLKGSTREELLRESLAEILPSLVRTAKALWVVSRQRPPADDMPAFYW